MTEALGHALSASAPALFDLFVRGALLLAVAAVAARLMRGASASLRHLVWASALWALLVLPLMSLLVPNVAVPILPSRSGASRPEAPPAIAMTGPNVTAPARMPEDVAPSASSRATAATDGQAVVPNAVHSAIESPAGISDAADSAWTWGGVVVGVWALVALVLLAEMGRSRLRLRWLAGGAWRIHDPAWWRAAARIGAALGLRRPVLLLATERTRVPLTWGTRAPIVLLPANADRWPAERREAVLVHELAHVARGDARGHDIARVAAALFWANPLVWVALRMMRAERERACDDLVLATGTRASSYAGDLLEIALTVGGRSHGAAAALAMARPSELEGRLLAILDPCIPRRPANRATRLVAGVVALLMVVPLAALRPAERTTVERSIVDAPLPPSATEPVAPPRAALSAVISAPAAGLYSAPPEVRSSAPNPEAPSVDSVAVRPDAELAADLETLIAVARAAGTMSSDHEKAELLLAVLAQGVRNDSLQTVVLRSASTIGSSFHRHRVMNAMLRAGLAPRSEAQFLRATTGISGSHERTVVLTAFAKANSLDDPAIRQAYLQAVVSVSGQHERTQLLALVIRRLELDASAAIDVLAAIRSVTSSHEKANLLVALAGRGVTDDPTVRDAFLIEAASLKSASDYKRVMRAAGIVESGASDRSLE